MTADALKYEPVPIIEHIFSINYMKIINIKKKFSIKTL